MKKILVIEAQADTRNLFLEGIKAEGFHTIGAENGRIGIEVAQQELPDLIISEIALPKLDGYGVLIKLRQNPVTAIIPFICVTVEGKRIEYRKAMELGANDYITKPCTLEELLKAIATQLEKQRLLTQWYAKQSESVREPPSIDTVTSWANPEPILPSDPQLCEVFRFIEANYHRQIALGDVAQAVGYSPAYLTNLMRRQTGQTVQRWIIQRRMAAAGYLLLETDQVVGQIAAKVGYQHQVHFFRQFRQLHGTTPQAWRSAHRS
ncbi:response regulator transcription factor [Microseira wollei]|uniref:Two component AraC family transcriptional regulator n=1 Tax=Microseira wollei NIES-4236 TaxID=2530354 RepID=A0AAV3XTB3_9CYAN|nr:helix-turn-helix domain-containing protein [Microseira wollei]GET44092.1 two component AraC family transcriptional regulator [Microseira wollei NIES-4236]